MEISPYELGLDAASLPQSPFYPQTTAQGPSFLDNQGCLCAIQTSPEEGISEAVWHCIGNQTQGVYDTLGGKWFDTMYGGDEVNGAIGDMSNGPNTEITYIWVEDGLQELPEDNELSVYDEACTGDRHEIFSFAYYGASRQKNRGEILTDAAPCWRPGAVPIQIQTAEEWMADGCYPGFSCQNNTVNSLPQYCPPIDECQMARLSGRMCSLNDVNIGMGPFEPVFCQGGNYCPGSSDGGGQYKCPEGTYCQPGSAQPTPCGAGSYCPESSSNERIWIPLLVLAIVDVIIVAVMLLSKYSSRRRRIAAAGASPETDNRNSNPSFTFNSYNSISSEALDNDVISAQRLSERFMYPPSASHSPNPSESTIQVPSPTFSRANTPPVDAAFLTIQEKQQQQQDEHAELNSFLESMKRATEASSLGLVFSYSDLSVRPKGASRPILDEVTGHVDCGTLTAVMGASGAGKSTFINVLMGKTKHTGGTVSINGNPGRVGRYKKVIGYVPQDDIVLPELTAAENIAHSARVRLPRSWTQEHVNAHVNAIIDCLELSHVRDSLVGSVEKPVLSGGQRKRVSIGMELAAAPMAIFLDEPTSGLDATSAVSLMRTLKGLAQLGISIILTIHQPRSEIFDMIDSLIVFSSGRTIYQGPRSDCQPFFEDLDYRFPRHGSNFGDALMDIVTGNGRTYKRYGDVSKESLITHWAERQSRIANSSASNSKSSSELLTSRSSQALKNRGASRFKQTWLCFERAMLQQARSKTSLLAEMGLSAFAGFMLGLAQFSREGYFFAGYYQEPYTILTTAVDFKSAPELALLVAICIGLSAAAPGVRVLSEESLLHRREAEAGHSRLAYFIAKFLSTVPRMILICFHFTSLLMILATPIIPWYLAFLVNLLYIYCIFGLANVVSAVARRQDAPFLATMLSLIVAILSGASPPLAQVVEWKVEWLWRTSPGVWLAEIYFGQLVKPFENIYQVDLAAELTGYHLNWLWFNMSIMFAIGTIYRVIAFALMCLMPRLRRWWR